MPPPDITRLFKGARNEFEVEVVFANDMGSSPKEKLLNFACSEGETKMYFFFIVMFHHQSILVKLNQFFFSI